MKKCIIVIITVLCLSIILSCFICKSNAVGLGVLGNPTEYIQGTPDDKKAIEIANIVVWIIRTVGEAISVIMLMIIGIKYVIRQCRRKGRI